MREVQEYLCGNEKEDEDRDVKRDAELRQRVLQTVAKLARSDFVSRSSGSECEMACFELQAAGVARL